MARVASKGLARANELYQERDTRVRELRAEGQKVVGYLCIYPITEMMTAAGLVPYRIFGDLRETVTEADTVFTTVCPFLRSTLDLGLKGRDDFLEGVVFAHTCDEGCWLAEIWRATVDMPLAYFMDTSSSVLERGQRQMKAVVQDFQKYLEDYTGTKITPAKLRQAIRLQNQQRALVRELYDLRKPDPPLISGAETLKVLKAVMSIPVEEGSQLLREVIAEVKQRKEGRPQKKAVRLLIWGPVIDDTSFVEMIESLDANVVMDDTCVGTRPFFDDVKVTDDPLDGLAYHYLVDLKCPRTYRGDQPRGDEPEGSRNDYFADLESRFSYLKDYVKDWKVNGVVLEVMRYCDSHGYEVPSLRDYLESIGVPNIPLEQDYSEAALAPMKTRVQGFLEVIGG